MRMSSLNRFLPAYFEFLDDKQEAGSSDLSPKTLKRAKLEEKHEMTKKLIADCDDDMSYAHSDEFYADCETPATGDEVNYNFYKRIKGELFLD